ncbi:EexN family lipoprotein [Rosenbergiella nectarea]
MKKIIILMTAVFTLSACCEKNYSIDDILKDEDLMHKIIAKC